MAGKMEETKFEAEISNLNAMTAKIQAEMMKIMEETRKIAAERRWYPIASAGVGATIAAVIVALSKFAS
jgi:NAD-specific glutamate dehydrogenase